MKQEREIDQDMEIDQDVEISHDMEGLVLIFVESPVENQDTNMKKTGYGKQDKEAQHQTQYREIKTHVFITSVITFSVFSELPWNPTLYLYFTGSIGSIFYG